MTLRTTPWQSVAIRCFEVSSRRSAVPMRAEPSIQPWLALAPDATLPNHLLAHTRPRMAAAATQRVHAHTSQGLTRPLMADPRLRTGLVPAARAVQRRPHTPSHATSTQPAATRAAFRSPGETDRALAARW
ncbi:hypothetical protein PsYK624_101580 [Phanerochaete sordida]|uniref:Uncharacterized protein n=1 Tax=Phanerochaete sordida TaxID=48140 RepID=A0A9P3GFT4_9APHY|nr:hypothetical protein PsYK624_101580 [Phanerochaete sordida]